MFKQILDKILENWLEIFWNLILRYFLLFIIAYLTQSITKFTDEQIIYLVNCLICSELVLYEIWNFKNTKISYLFGLLLSWLFVISFMNFFELNLQICKILFIFQIYETFISLFWLGYGEIPDYKLLLLKEEND